MAVRRFAAFLLVTGLACVHAAEASAASKSECISAFDAGQRAKREGRLKHAHESLLVCSQTECPVVVRTDCADALKQVDAALPTIVIGASDAKGNDLTDVAVELDGKAIATSLDGRAITVDPGKLTLVFKRPPWEPVTTELVIKEAEKNRSVRVTLGPPAPTPAPVAATQPAPAPIETPTRSVVGYAVPAGLAALGLGSLAFAGITRLGAGSDADDLKASCGPTCPASERDALSSDLVRANVFFGIGLGTLALAAVSWFVFSPPLAAPSTSTSNRGSLR